jgi:hypothetical protein
MWTEERDRGIVVGEFAEVGRRRCYGQIGRKNELVRLTQCEKGVGDELYSVKVGGSQ